MTNPALRAMRMIPLVLLLPPAQQVVSQIPYNPATLGQIAEAERHIPAHGTLRNGGPPTRGFDMKYARCEWNLDPAVHYISGSITSWFTATADLDQVIFDLSDALEVDDVVMHGNALTFTHGPGTQLVIDLPATLPAGQLDSLTVIYQGAPPNTGFGSFVTETHAGVPVLWTLSEPYGAKDWWPCKDDLNDKIDSLDCLVTVPIGNRAAGNGLLVGADTTGDQVTRHWRSRNQNAHYLVATAVTNYLVDEQYAQLTDGDLLMLTYAYPESFSNAVSAATAVLPVITLFDSLFGAYPFANEKYGHAQFSCGGGMEHQTMSFMGSFHPEIMAHELAHQWFGDKVTCGSWAELWLNEGFATYLSGLSYEHLAPFYWPIWKRNLVNQITGQPGGSVFVTDTLDNNRLFDSRLTYNKAAMVVHMLRWVCGDSAFYAGLRNYLDDPELAYGSVTTADLQSHLEAASGLDLTGFLADWYTGEGYPSYTTVWSQDDAGTVTVTLSQATSHPSVDFFELPVPLQFLGEGQDSTVVLNNTTNNQVFNFHLPFAVDSVAFDPEIWLISRQNIVTRVGTSESGQGALLLRPNPATDRIAWHVPAGFIPRTFHVWDAHGRLLAVGGDVRSGHLNIARLAPGAYTLELRGGTDSLRARFVKE